MFDPKIIALVGEKVWNAYKLHAESAFARAEGVPIEKSSFSWDAAAITAYPSDKGRVSLTTEWRGHTWRDVFDAVQPAPEPAETATTHDGLAATNDPGTPAPKPAENDLLAE
jgi:hypothetical protein